MRSGNRGLLCNNRRLTRPLSRPVNFVVPWTYDTIGKRKRDVAARADESEYLSGKKAGIILMREGMASIAAPGLGL